MDIDGIAKRFHYEDLQNFPLHAQVVKEILRLHSPIQSIMRIVENSIEILGIIFIIPMSNALLASPSVTSRAEEHFPEFLLWSGSLTAGTHLLPKSTQI